ncbi:MAG: DUF4834 family protein [Bacteroidia bacterium]|nr:DUF4834 family protein [Bacteroidia bacterium]
MLKFLFYLFIFYVIYRYVFGGFKVKVFHYHQNTPPPQPNSYKEEGEITINPKVNKKKSATDDKLGEYVDYEEVK